jgi:putative transposase
MGRQLRILFSGAVYHVISRGNERKNIFRDENDRIRMLKTLREGIRHYQINIYSYVLMSNHYHFLLETKLPNLSRVMQFVNTSYALYFNTKYERCGHLFQSRYKAYIVQKNEKLAEVTRYIHMNPIRAGMVKTLPEYRWSSHLQYTGAEIKGIAAPEFVLNQFAEKRTKAVGLYEDYMTKALVLDNKQERKKMYGDYILGDDDYIRKIKLLFKENKLSKEILERSKIKRVYEPHEIIGAAVKYFKMSEEELRNKKGKWNPGKKVTMFLLGRDAGITYSDISEMMNGLHYSGIGKICRKVAAECERRGKVREMVKGIEKIYVKKGSTDDKILSTLR